MKEVLITFDANVEVSKSSKSTQTIEDAKCRLVKVIKEESTSFRVEVDDNEGNKAVFSRTISDKASFEITSSNTLVWTDRRGVYTFTFEDATSTENLHKLLIQCRKEKGSLSIASPRKANASPRTSLRKSGSPRGNVTPPTTPNKGDWAAGQGVKKRGVTVSMGGYREEPLKTPAKAKIGYIDPTKKRGSYLKRRVLNSSTSILPTEKESRRKELVPTPSEGQFFQTQIAQAQLVASLVGPQGMKNIRITPKWESSVYVTQILLGEEDFNIQYDKKLVPTQLSRCIKLLSGATDKKWLLCAALPWNELQKLPEIKEQGVKKSTEPYLVAEYLINILRDLSPIIVLDNFEPQESFMKISGDENLENTYLNECIESQPPTNKAILGALISFLKNFLKNQKSNLLTVEHLAKQFGPFIITGQTLSYEKHYPVKLLNTLLI